MIQKEEFLINPTSHTEARTARGFHFSVIPTLEGRWSGGSRYSEIPAFEDSPSKDNNKSNSGVHTPCCEKLFDGTSLAVSTKISFVDEEKDKEYWLLRETKANVDGISTVFRLKLVPIANGTLRVELLHNNSNENNSTSPLTSTDLSSMDLRLSERSFGLQMVGTSIETKEMELCWLLRYTKNADLERTILSYNGGSLSSITHIYEKRVIEKN